MSTDTKATHTPGPWDIPETAAGSVRAGSSGYAATTIGFGEFAVCQIVVHGSQPQGDGRRNPIPTYTAEDVANARLIAAAPDLLAACEALARSAMAVAHQYRYPHEVNQETRDAAIGGMETDRINASVAIAKARGGA